MENENDLVTSENEVNEKPDEKPAEEVKETVTEEKPAEAVEEKKSEEKPAETAKEKKPSSGKKKALIGAGVAAVVLIILAVIVVIIVAIVLVIVLHKPTVNLDDYITIEAEGYNGYGKAICYFDTDRFYEENGSTFKISKTIKDQFTENVFSEYSLALYNVDLDNKEDGARIFLLFTALDGNLSNSYNLSNGDVITYSWDSIYTDEELAAIAKSMHVKLAYSDISYTVEGLEEVPMFDPFDGVEVSFSGTAPNGQALIANYPDNGLIYEIDGENQGLSNGDEVVVRIQYPYDDVESYIRQYERIANTETKTFTVEGLGSYITSASQIPEEALKAMKDQSNDIILGTTYNWIDGYTLDIDYIGNYFLTAKDSTSTPNNMFVLVYKCHYENTVKDYKKKDCDIQCDYYFYVNWDDLQVKPDGTFYYSEKDYFKTKNELTYYWNNIKTYDGVWDFQDEYLKLTFTGYEKLDDIYNAYITRNIENYKFEDNIDESLADSPEEETEEAVETE